MFLEKGQIVNMFGLVGLVVSIAINKLPLQGGSSQRRYTEEWAWLRSNKAVFIKQEAGRVWPKDCNLPSPDLR